MPIGHGVEEEYSMFPSSFPSTYWLSPDSLTLKNHIQVLQRIVDILRLGTSSGAHEVVGGCTLAETRDPWEAAKPCRVGRERVGRQQLQ